MPGLLSSPVCLTVIWFLSWSLRLSSAQTQSDEVSGIQFGQLDSNVTLGCRESQIRFPVVWRLNNSSVLPWHQVTPSGALVLLHANQSAQGNYSCYDNTGLLLHSVKLQLGRPPGRLSISCRVPNHTHVRCSWVETSTTLLPAKYNASYRGNSQGWRPCIMDASNRHCDIVNPSFWQPVHVLRVTQTNALQSRTSYERFKLHELLKPDPPDAVCVEQLEGFPKRLKVSWSLPSSWPLHDGFPLEFHIRYRPQGSAFWSEFLTDESPAVIFDALAGHLHHVQVRAHDGVGSYGEWSEWSPAFLIKPWEVPSTPEPDEEEISTDFIAPPNTKPETSTAKSHNPAAEDEGHLGLVILLVLFSVVILTTVLSLVFVVWVKQRRRHHVTKQELTSMVKMKSMSI